MELGLTDKVALVTGAGGQKSYGKGIALVLAKEGCDVVVVDIDLAGAERTAAEVESLGRKTLAVKADVADSTQINEMIQAALAKFGRIDILVNNAGVSSPNKPFWEKSEADWDYDINVNLRGTMNCARAVIGQMLERKSGKIINISSIAVRGGAPFASIYTAAKCGIVGFTKSLALEVSHLGINVNNIAPGLAMTNFVSDDPPELIEELTVRTPTRRINMFLVISEATKPIRRMLMSRCSFEKPSSEERFLRTMSPSRRVTGRPPSSRSLTRRALARVDFPAPESPVKNTVNPRR